MTDAFLMSDDIAPRAEFYREKAQEIRRAARRATSPDAVRDLLETAAQFDRMAAFVENSRLGARTAHHLADLKLLWTAHSTAC